MPNSLFRYWFAFNIMLDNGNVMPDAIGLELDAPIRGVEDIHALEGTIYQELAARRHSDGSKVFETSFAIRIMTWTKFDEGSGLVIPKGAMQ